MKEYLADLVRQMPTPTQGRNVARGYLQARILATLQRAGAMIQLAFHGGTALRFLYAHGRYSEDLDFALEGDRQRYDFRGYLRAIRAELTPEGYSVELKVNDQKTVHSAFVRFLACSMTLSYRGTAVKCWRSSSKWTPTRPPARVWN
jgi:Nucleotidyl transferase AbiEii toxin, Type IV TA system